LPVVKADLKEKHRRMCKSVFNDYDETVFMPYAFDLVRLATSACLSPPANASVAKVVAAVLAGYRTGLASAQAPGLGCCGR
jgi:uncharacterized protein (DUF2252 family)